MTWEERMADRARHQRDAEEAEREESLAWRRAHPDPTHHMHDHGGVIRCSCGQGPVSVYSVAIRSDGPPVLLSSCSVCGMTGVRYFGADSPHVVDR